MGQPVIPTPKPAISMQKMPDGSFRICGLSASGRVHLKKEMRAWRQENVPLTGKPCYVSFSRREAEEYAGNHGLTIREPTQS